MVGMRRGLTAMLAGTLLCGLVAGPALAGSEVRIRRVDARASLVEATVSVTNDGLPSSGIEVEEDGRPVSWANVRSLADSGKRVEVVLAIDSSGSMQGAGLKSASTAASEFVEGLPSAIEVGVLAFSSRPHAVLPVGGDHVAARAELSRLEARGETALYDAVRAAAAMFSPEGQHEIVLLSDGGDTASRTSLRAAIEAASDASAPVYAVGLRTSETDVGSLRRLAAGSGGRYQPAATAQLGEIYRSLARELSRQYVVSYRTHATPGQPVRVTVIAAGGRDSDVLTIPQGKSADQGADRVDSGATTRGPAPIPAWQLGMVLTLCFIAVLGLSRMFLGGGERRRSVARLKTATRPVASPLPSTMGEKVGSRWIPAAATRLGERIAEGSAWAARLDVRLERAGTALRAGEFVAGVGLAALGGYVLGVVLSSRPSVGLLCAVLAALAPHVTLRRAVHRRSQKMHAQLPDVLAVLASSLRAGHSFLQSLDMAAREIQEPAASEFGRLIAEIRLGRPPGEALTAMADRVDNEDFKWAMLAVNVQRETGGNLAEVLDTVAETLRERQVVRRQVKALSAEGRLSMFILGGLPVVLALYMLLVNPDYIGLLFATPLGLLMSVTGCCLLAIGFAWMRKVVKIDV
ncbi:MAG: type II secretion system F family protein [Actinomycetota bacterium]